MFLFSVLVISLHDYSERELLSLSLSLGLQFLSQFQVFTPSWISNEIRVRRTNHRKVTQRGFRKRRVSAERSVERKKSWDSVVVAVIFALPLRRWLFCINKQLPWTLHASNESTLKTSKCQKDRILQNCHLTNIEKMCLKKTDSRKSQAVTDRDGKEQKWICKCSWGPHRRWVCCSWENRMSWGWQDSHEESITFFPYRSSDSWQDRPLNLLSRRQHILLFFREQSWETGIASQKFFFQDRND